MSRANYLSAKELGLSPLARQGLIKFIQFVEDGKLKWIENDITKFGNYVNRKDRTPNKFSLGWWHEPRECGTIACIAGTAEALVDFNRGSYSDIAGKLAVEGRPGLRDLFSFEFEGRGGFSFPRAFTVTPEEAAEATRNYLATGKPDWRGVVEKAA